jgi:hypothetical protein
MARNKKKEMEFIRRFEKLIERQRGEPEGCYGNVDRQSCHC